jgi:hypothetical protein
MVVSGIIFKDDDIALILIREGNGLNPGKWLKPEDIFFHYKSVMFGGKIIDTIHALKAALDIAKCMS